MNPTASAFRRPRILALAAVASASLLAGCGGGADARDEIAKQVEIAKQAADRAVAAQQAAEAAAKGGKSGSSLAGTGFRKDSGDEPKFGAPSDGSKAATNTESEPKPGSDYGPPPPGSLPAPGA